MARKLVKHIHFLKKRSRADLKVKTVYNYLVMVRTRREIGHLRLKLNERKTIPIIMTIK